MTTARPSSPCIQICTISPQTKLCEGCARTIEEVVRWGGMSEAERLAVMALLPARRQAAKTDS